MIDEASLSMIDRIDSAISTFQVDFGGLLESEGHARAGARMKLEERRSAMGQGMFGEPTPDDEGKSFLYQQLALIMEKIVAVASRASSSTEMALEARRRVLEAEILRGRSMHDEHQRMANALARSDNEVARIQTEQELEKETAENLYYWPTAALPPSAAPVDDLVADHLQLRSDYAQLQAKCEMLEEEIAGLVAETSASAAADVQAVTATTSGEGEGRPPPAQQPPPAADSQALEGALAAAGATLASGLVGDIGPDKAWDSVEKLLDTIEADARGVGGGGNGGRLPNAGADAPAVDVRAHHQPGAPIKRELSPTTTVQVAIGSLSLRDMKSAMSRERGSLKQRTSSSRGGSGVRRTNSARSVAHVSKVDWSDAGPDVQLRRGGSARSVERHLQRQRPDALSLQGLMQQEELTWQKSGPHSPRSRLPSVR
jgi:hypothetical protein